MSLLILSVVYGQSRNRAVWNVRWRH